MTHPGTPTPEPARPVDGGPDPGPPEDAEVAVELAVAGGVVVGHDGSPSAAAALRWAADDAARRRTTLHVVRCWLLVTAPRPPSWRPDFVPPLPDWEAAVRRDLRRDASATADLTGVEVRWHTVHGRPEEVLARATVVADLVVVGSRGHGRLHEMLLGSVAEHVLHHARGPVVVVPVAQRADASGPVQPV